MTSQPAIVYLSYDGMTDPLGRSQVLPYLAGLAARGHAIELVSLDKPDALARDGARVAELARAAGIAWTPLAYRSFPPIAAGWRNVAALRRAGTAIMRRMPVQLIHCRSDLAGIAGLALKRRCGLPLLYDMRALWPDERAEGGAWDQSKPLYRALLRHFKRRQRELVERADAIVVLADAARDLLPALGLRPPTIVETIPCCADFDHFTLPDPATRAARRAELGVGAAPLLLHLGSIGGNVMLGEMLEFLAVWRGHHPGAQILFLAPSGGDQIAAAAAARGLADAVILRSAGREAVPTWIGAADLGLLFVRPVPSKRAASPTKLAEMLAVGLPVVANAGIGDVAAILRDTGAGVVIDRFDPAAYDTAITALAAMPTDPATIRDRARAHVDLDLGVERYDTLYRRLAPHPSPEPNIA